MFEEPTTMHIRRDGQYGVPPRQSGQNREAVEANEELVKELIVCLGEMCDVGYGVQSRGQCSRVEAIQQ